MGERCPTARILGPAVLLGHRIAFTRWSPAWGGGVADAVAADDHEVWGLLWELQPDDLVALDAYEGHPHMYVRDRVRVHVGDTPVDDVWTYRVREKVDHVPPTPRYVEVMLQAGLEHGFPDDYLDHVRGIETA